MQIFRPIETIAEFRSLDEGDILCGYLDGLAGAGCEPAQTTRAYWHGWRNGLVDGGFMEPDEAQVKLAVLFQILPSRTLREH